jgi:hypothetical protein
LHSLYDQSFLRARDRWRRLDDKTELELQRLPNKETVLSSIIKMLENTVAIDGKTKIACIGCADRLKQIFHG